MSRLKFKITEDKDTMVSKVTTTMTNDVAEEITETLKGVFELEMLTAKTRVKNGETVITFKSRNYDRIKMIRESMTKYYFESTIGNHEN